MKIRIENDVDDGPCVYIDDTLAIVGDKAVCVEPRVIVTKSTDDGIEFEFTPLEQK